jgi:phosphoribosylpyrophosphate synthetase
VFVTDSVAVDRSWPTLRIVSIAPLVAAAIRQVLAGGSLSDLYQDVPTRFEQNRWTDQTARK